MPAIFGGVSRNVPPGRAPRAAAAHRRGARHPQPLRPPRPADARARRRAGRGGPRAGAVLPRPRGSSRPSSGGGRRRPCAACGSPSSRPSTGAAAGSSTRTGRSGAGSSIEGTRATVYHSGDTAFFERVHGDRRALPAHRRGAAADRRLRPGLVHGAAAHEPRGGAARRSATSARGTFVAMHWGTFKLTDEPLDEPPRRLEAERRRLGLASRARARPRHRGDAPGRARRRRPRPGAPPGVSRVTRAGGRSRPARDARAPCFGQPGARGSHGEHVAGILAVGGASLDGARSAGRVACASLRLSAVISSRRAAAAGAGVGRSPTLAPLGTSSDGGVRATALPRYTLRAGALAVAAAVALLAGVQPRRSRGTGSTLEEPRTTGAVRRAPRPGRRRGVRDGRGDPERQGDRRRQHRPEHRDRSSWPGDGRHDDDRGAPRLRRATTTTATIPPKRRSSPSRRSRT